MTSDADFIVSIDGPSASGKTTLAGALCSQFKTTRLDTGLTFRAVAWAVASGIPQAQALNLLGSRIVHEVPLTGSASFWDRITVDGRDRLDDILAPELEPVIRDIAQDDDARTALQQYHLQIVSDLARVVVIGRDIASQLLPQALAHVYLHASTEERNRRRARQVREGDHRSELISPPSAVDLASLEYVSARPNGLALDTTSFNATDVIAEVAMFIQGLDGSLGG